jgi:predicted acyltransferase
MACVAIATCMWLIDVHRATGWWTRFFVIYGTNPMIAFLGSGLMARLIYSIINVTHDGKPMKLESAIYQTFYASWLAPINASLLFAITFVLLWFGILSVLHRKGIVFKV